MRTFMTFLACTGFIVWAHSRDTRIIGVQPHPLQQSPVAKQSIVARQGQQTMRDQYLRELVSAASLKVIDNAPSSYLVTLLHNKRYFSNKADSMLLRFRPQQVLRQ
jgi:hypothetical protein